LEFLSFEDLRDGVPEGIDILINAGEAGSAWSGGDYWKDDKLVETLSKWVHEGGVFVGVGEPSAVSGYATYFRMAHVLGVDMDDNGERTCHNSWDWERNDVTGLFPEESVGLDKVFLTDGKANVVEGCEGAIGITVNDFGKGKGLYIMHIGIYLGFDADISSFYNVPQKLCKLLLYAATGSTEADGLSSNEKVECAVFPGKIVFINNTPSDETASCSWKGQAYTAELKPYEMKVIDHE